MRLDGGDALAGGHVPQPHGAVLRAAGDLGAVRRVLGAGDVKLVTLQGGHRVAHAHVPDLDGLRVEARANAGVTCMQVASRTSERRETIRWYESRTTSSETTRRDARYGGVM